MKHCLSHEEIGRLGTGWGGTERAEPPRPAAGRAAVSPGEVTYLAYDRDGNLVSKVCLSRAMFQVPGVRPMPPAAGPDEPFVVGG
jgi:hypothetical protein